MTTSMFIAQGKKKLARLSQNGKVNPYRPREDSGDKTRQRGDAPWDSDLSQEGKRVRATVRPCPTQRRWILEQESDVNDLNESLAHLLVACDGSVCVQVQSVSMRKFINQSLFASCWSIGKSHANVIAVRSFRPMEIHKTAQI